ncbi:MAG: ExeM/NucH family extracellular endonuclease, partial [Euzebya sp.]
MTLRRSISTFALLSLLASIMALAPLAPASAATAVFINELHYDNDGADVGEFVEVAGPAGTDLTGWSIVLYNGSGGASYATVDLSGTVDDQGEGFGAVSFAQAGIQNGSPDGLALVNGSTVEQFLSYEGAFSATNGDANGMMSVDIGVSEPSTSPVG